MKRHASPARSVAVFLAALAIAAFPRAGRAQETESSVPELAAFHEVIYPMWHTAYPEKDYAGLRRLAPEVKSDAEKIYAAKLPGILRDRQAKWDQGVVGLRRAVDAYLAAAAGSDDPALLQAAEALHARFEMLVRIIRPVLKEVDDFHKVLYVVYHKDLPEKAYGRIKGAAPELAAKAEAITKAALPKRLETREGAFRQAAAALHQATLALGQAEEGPALAAAVESVHARYQALERVFE